MMRPSLRHAFRQIELEQGDASEKYFEDVLQQAKDHGKLPPWLLGWSHSEKWSPTDSVGIDFLVWTDRGRIKINTKSSYSRAKQFRDHQRKNGDGHHDEILAVVVNILERPETFLGRFIRTISAVRDAMPEPK